ncbi:MAG: helix-turn-helix transcriptional regulator [Bacteroidales bacterium]|nr:helix-turn-helix transcriptional regulator [Bacteroidales bacterium]
MEQIGITIKERRKELGINQQELAELAAVGINSLVAIERGKGNPSMKTLLRILDVLGLEIKLSRVSRIP